jgi:membrane fusion protein, multidrug efflux system
MRLKQWIRAGLVLAALGAAALAVRARAPSDARAATGKEGAAPADRVVPVVAAMVEQRDVPIYLEGLGNVAASITVTVRPQVDGRLDRVAFREGQEVKKGDLLAEIDPRPFLADLHTAEATLARDNAVYRGHKRAYDRLKALLDNALATQQDVDNEQAATEQAEATMAADRAQIESARLKLDYAHITAPSDGVTGVRLVDQGNVVRAADATGLVVITNVDPIAVIFTLPEDDLARVTEQMNAGPVAVEALSRDGGGKLGEGKLALIDNQINQATATLKLKALFPNPMRTLWPNQFVKARLLLTTRKNARVVPASVVQRGPDGAFAYVIGDDQKVSARPVQVETTEGELSLIATGLTPGERVVADGQSQLRPGSRVSTRAPGDAAPAGSGSAGPGGKRRGPPADGAAK